jgi:hypothetical protein
MKNWIATIAVCLLVQPALALLDDGQDSLGCYFDDLGDVNCFDPTPGVPFTLYFILANPWEDCVGYFEFAWRFEPPLDLQPAIYDLVLPPMSLNLGDEQNLMVGIAYGLTSSPATVLASITVMTLAPVSSGQGVAVGPSTPSMFYECPGYGDCSNLNEIWPMNYSSWPAGQASGWWTVAALGCSAQVVAAESATWGDVKPLYR